MRIFQRFKIWQFEKTRLEGLSDGVFSIIMTLLILEIKIPHDFDNRITNSQALWDELKHLASPLVSWLISFVILGLFWRNHHCIFKMAKRSDYALVWMNIFFLLFLSFVPFPAHLMGTYPRIPLAVASLGIVMFPATALMAAMYYYIAKNYLVEDYDKATVLKNVRLAFWTAPVIYAVAILLAWINPLFTFICYTIIPFLFILPLDKPISANHHKD
jgi:uncharacterized membrane protein